MKQTSQKVSSQAAKLMKYPGKLTAPIPNLEDRTPQEVFVMMCNRIESMTQAIVSVAASAMSQDETPMPKFTAAFTSEDVTEQIATAIAETKALEHEAPSSSATAEEVTIHPSTEAGGDDPVGEVEPGDGA